MAITTNATLLVRRGLEADFQPEKMKQGEWALSTDSRYIRMCVANGVCIRMATYEAFEQDMEIIQQIVSEARDIESTLLSIQEVVSGKADQVEVWAAEAEESATQAKHWAEVASEYVVEPATPSKAGVVKPDGSTTEVDADGTIHVIGGGSGGDAESIIRGYELTGYLSRNLLNTNNLSYGWMHEDGTYELDTTNYWLSEYIMVEPNTKYTLSGLDGQMNAPAVCEFNISKDRIAGHAYSYQTELSFITGENTKYIRVSIKVAIADQMQFELGDKTPYTKYAPSNSELEKMIKNISYYSTEERIVGVWINNKTIYQKTYHIPVISAATTQIPEAIGGLDTVVDIQGTFYSAHFSQWYAQNNIHLSNYLNDYYILTIVNGGKPEVRIGAAHQQYHLEGYLTIQYTKN